MPSRGRPKGAEKTVIGLKKKKPNASASSSKHRKTLNGKPDKFLDLSNSQREKMILKWCLGDEKAQEFLAKSGKYR